MIPPRNHPAHRARRIAAVASGAGLLVLTGCMAVGTTSRASSGSSTGQVGTTTGDDGYQFSPSSPSEDVGPATPAFPGRGPASSSRGS